MRLLGITSFVLAALLSAAAASAYDVKSGQSPEPGPKLTAVMSCDLDVEFNAFFQDEARRWGNAFDLGLAGALISRVEFKHFGFETLSGPYTYDIEVWDDATCTMIGQTADLMAADAFNQTALENVNLCAYNFRNDGMTAVVIHSKSCADPPANTDCYPDLWFDANAGALCPRVINPVAGTCVRPIAVPGPNGAFLLRIETDACPTPVAPQSWGAVKAIYR